MRSFLRKLGLVAATFLSGLFGRVRWEPPGWLRFLGGRLAAGGRWARGHKALAAALVAAVGLAGGGGFLGHRWWKNRPRPEETTITVHAPEATPIEERAKPNPLVLEFDHPAAPLPLVGKVVTAGVTLSPPLEGTWRWDGDSRLTFTPRGDWPVGQAYEVRLARDAVTPKVRLATREVSFSSAPFTARITEKEFYQDPTDPNLKKVVVTLAFSHPPDAAALEGRIHLRLVPSDREEKERDQGFHLSFDRLHGRAFVHSTPITVPRRDATMVVTIDAGTHAARGGPPFAEALGERVAVPGLYNFLKVESARITIADNERNEPEQVLVLETSAGVADAEMGAAVRAFVLPVLHPDQEKLEGDDKRPHDWSNAEEVDESILKRGRALPLQAIAGEKEYSTLHSFRFKAPPPEYVGRWIWVEVKKGLRAFGGYILGEPFVATARIEAFPRQLRILHEGALLRLSGERKVAVLARDVPALRVEIGRVLPSQLQHLITQSNGPFAHPSFHNWSFGPDNLTEITEEVRPLAGNPPGRPSYEAIDLGARLKERGVFLLRVESWDPEHRRALGERDERLVVVSDLGIVVKEAADGAHDVFVQSIADGGPVAGAEVEVLGANGLPALSAHTDGEGHARVGTFRELRRDRRPVVWLVTRGRDSAFLPVGRMDRQLEMSRFDVGGVVEPPDPRRLSAYLFSDRGLYRPGEELRFGLIVRSQDWRAPLDGVPVQAVLTDARGLTVRKEVIKLHGDGFEELRHTTPETAPTGTYTLSLFIVRDGKPGPMLGSTTVRVREFLPDRMKIAVHLSKETPARDLGGWLDPKDLKGRVTLTNLFGTPAADRTVRARISLTPALPDFPRLPDYHFFDPLRGSERFSDALSEAETGEDGVAELDLGLGRFAPATYRLSLFAEGFEAEGGRSVAGEVSAIVSPARFLVGYKPDGDLSYLGKGSSRGVDLVAVGPKGERVEAKGLRAVLYERRYLSVLTRQDSGTYKYQSVRREIELSSKGLDIPEKGRRYTLPTDKPGDFALVVKNGGAGDEPVQRVEFSVAGAANLSRSLEKEANLELRLAQKDVEAGQELEVAIRAPYAGAGLVTIEREKVFAFRWFKTSTTATVEKIRVPEDFEGDGYLSVTFLRDAASDEIFTGALAYGVVPFSVSRARRTAKVTVETPDLARPGEPFKMKVKVDRPARVAVFAVDEGILRVARYEAPDPLAFFFRKRALGVRTQQILDLVLPEYSQLLAALAPGGDDEAALASRLNPFKRKRVRPTAYWSGLIEVGPDGKELVYPVPDSFNGTLRVMAVAVEPESVGVFEKKAIVRGDFVITPTAPVAVAPGDTFQVPVTVANNAAGSGDKASLRVGVKPSKELEVVGAAEATLTVGELREGTATFTVRARRELGPATLAFTAALAGGGKAKPAHLVEEVSVRPASPYLVTFDAGHVARGAAEARVKRRLHAEFRSLRAGISHLPLGLTHGLAGYLEKYPHGCTEQVASQAVPAIVLGRRPEFGFTAESAAKSVGDALAVLRTRQNDEGAFGLWAASPRVHARASVYALQVLLEAKERGFTVPADVMRSGATWLQQVAREDRDLDGESGLSEGRTRAWAIYLLTRQGLVTGPVATALQKHLEANFEKEWRADLAAAYLAATWKLLRQDSLAERLIDSVKLGAPLSSSSSSGQGGYLHDRLAQDAQLLWLLARHFPERAARTTPEQLDALLEPVFQGRYNSFTSAFTILALDAFGEAARRDGDGAQSIREVVGGAERALPLPAGLLPLVDFSPEATALRFSSEGRFGSYWVVSQRGFDLDPPVKAMASKVEVFREYTDAQGKALAKVGLGDEVQVHVRVRASDGKAIPDLAIIDLLPGGFEVVVQAPAPGEEPGAEGDSGEGERGDEGGEGERGDGEGSEGSEGDGDEVAHDAPDEGGQAAGASFALPIALPATTFALDYGDVREDRVLLYGVAMGEAKEFVYAARATSAGTFTVPPIQAEGMYDRSVVARGPAASIEVVAR